MFWLMESKLVREFYSIVFFLNFVHSYLKGDFEIVCSYSDSWLIPCFIIHYIYITQRYIFNCIIVSTSNTFREFCPTILTLLNRLNLVLFLSITNIKPGHRKYIKLQVAFESNVKARKEREQKRGGKIRN